MEVIDWGRIEVRILGYIGIRTNMFNVHWNVDVKLVTHNFVESNGVGIDNN